VVHLPRYWYVACLSSELARRPLARVVLDTPLVLFRDGHGRPWALLDRCPHRNVPLSLGRVRADELECRYHGWRFDGGGSCRAVPGLLGPADRAARRAPAFPVREQDGFVWVFADAGEPPDLDPPAFPYTGVAGYVTVRRSLRVNATLHAALENTLDVPHTAFLHRGFFRGAGEPTEIEVVVRHGPGRVEAEYLGEPRPTGVVGRILAPAGGVVTHFDRFLLPSVAQVEYRLGRHHLVVFRGALPAPVVRAVVTPIANRVFAQDAMILARQADNIERFGAEHFASTELDVLGSHIRRLLRQAETGDTAVPTDAEHRVRIRV